MLLLLKFIGRAVQVTSLCDPPDFGLGFPFRPEFHLAPYRFILPTTPTNLDDPVNEKSEKDNCDAGDNDLDADGH
ncbi:MAG: hypothetical protein WBP42_02475 [Candidatus Zixiibacteriota bacterium]